MCDSAAEIRGDLEMLFNKVWARHPCLLDVLLLDLSVRGDALNDKTE